FSGGTQNPRIFSTAGWEIATVGTGSSRLIDFNNLTPSHLYDCRSAHYFGAGTWHHVVAVRTPNAMLLYIDGKLEGNIPATGTPDYSRNFVPEIGGNSGNIYDAFGGKIDEVCIFNRALTADEVSSLYEADNAGDYLEQPQIISQPAAQNVIAGDPASFNVDATGLKPLTFQWMFNGSPITGATNKTLVIPEAQPAQAGDYSVIVANAAGSTTSSNATLAVTVPDCTPPPAGLVAWWPGEGNAQDIAGGNNGIVSTGLSYTNGEIGQAFLLNNTNAYFHVLASSNLNVGLGSGFTIETWIKPANVNGLHPILEWNQDGVGGIGVQFWIGQTPSSQGVLCAFMLDTNGNNYLQVPSPNGTLVANTWQHVALTYDRTTHTITLYV
ncbi:MAG TPA: LamG-like jellyroll fold domain-containing protein, partial [Candidatus Binatia bacterium]|nr:LamG-like jellyroll fold domain-containing protein [Candidatus Binatia bacterium]